MKKSRLDYQKMEQVTKDYARQIIEEINESMPRDFVIDDDLEFSIENILDEMYDELKSSENKEYPILDEKQPKKSHEDQRTESNRGQRNTQVIAKND